jgi:hypothetical protein
MAMTGVGSWSLWTYGGEPLDGNVSDGLLL